jgi:hypothetical protein
MHRGLTSSIGSPKRMFNGPASIAAKDRASTFNAHYRAPQRTAPVLQVNKLPDSGFTLAVASPNRTADTGYGKDLVSLACASYRDHSHERKPACVDKFSILPTSSGFVSDYSTQLKMSGSLEARANDYPRHAVYRAPQSTRKEMRMEADAFVRAGQIRVLPLGHAMEEVAADIITSPQVYGEQVHKSDPSRWVRVVEDPHYHHSTTHILHKPASQAAYTRSMLKGNVAVGKKTPSGGVRNHFDHLASPRGEHEPAPPLGTPEARDRYAVLWCCIVPAFWWFMLTCAH